MIEIVSTDSPEDVVAAIGDAQPKDEKVEKVEAEEKNDKLIAKDDDDEDEGSDEDQPKKKGGFKRRIDRLNSKVQQAEQEREFWKQEALKAKESKTDDAQKPVVKTEDKPQAENFESHDDYVEALADWKTDQKLKEYDAKQRESKVKTEHQTRIEKHVSKVEAFAKDFPDFHEAMEDVDDIPLSLAVQEVILTSEDGPKLMYELAKNRDEYERICKLPALAAARALGAFEASLSPSKAEPKTTKAPPPIKPVSAKGSSVSKNPDEMNFREFKKWREQELKNV